MDDDTLRDLLILITGVAIAMLIELIKSLKKGYALKKNLLSELKTLRSELERVLLATERQIQIGSKGGVEYCTIIPIKAYIYDNFYKDIVQELNIDQRISYQLIHSTIACLNDKFNDQDALLDEFDSGKKISSRQLDRYKNLTKSIFITAHQADWHMQYHLANTESPKLLAGDATHEKYLKSLKAWHDQITVLEQSAVNVPLENFEMIYNPKDFESEYGNDR